MQNEQQVQDRFKQAITNKIESLRERIAAGEKIAESEKVQVVVLADSPNVPTGFGNVCREVLLSLHKTGLYSFEVVGINYDGSPHDLPFKIYPAVNALMNDPAYRDPYGKQRFLDMVSEGRFDLAWILQDTFIIGSELGEMMGKARDMLPPDSKFTWMFYFPIDAVPMKQWIDQSVALADFPVAYTKYGKDEVQKIYSVGDDTLLKPEEQEVNKKIGEIIDKKIDIVYHGVNTDNFYPIDDKEYVADLRKKLWNVHKDKFVFINVNRNQPRKDMYRTLKAFKILLDKRKAKGKNDVYLYTHCNVFDNGMNMVEMSRQVGLVAGDEWAYPDPKNFSPSRGYPVELVNEFYNASDAVISTSLGEGWGLSVVEGMAVKKPVIMPDHTSFREIIGKTDAGTGERGFFVRTRGDFVQQSDNSRVRPLTDEEHMAEVMEMVLENREDIQPIVDAAYEWVKEHTWDGEKIGGKWRSIFEKAYINTLALRALAVDEEIKQFLEVDGSDRNKICPVCQVKFKKCRHGV